MSKTRSVYYLSGTTGILAKEMGKALLSQFPDLSFHEELIPFIRTRAQAEAARDKILADNEETEPIIFSTLFSNELNSVFDISGVDYLNLCDQFLVRLEHLLDAEAIRKPGTARSHDDNIMNRRVNAIHYSIAHDDGTSTTDYDEADIIVVGVSRSGKTPVSIFLATQMGLKSANYPLVDSDLQTTCLPPELLRNMGKVVGLSTSPEMLHSYREKRFAGSRYAKLTTCVTELKQSDRIFAKYQIPVIFSGGYSIEEVATQAAQNLKFNQQEVF